MADSRDCPLCGNTLLHVSPVLGPDGTPRTLSEVTCRTCGAYRISLMLSNQLLRFPDSVSQGQRHRLSAITRRGSGGALVELLGDAIETLLAENPQPTYTGQEELILRFIARHSSPGGKPVLLEAERDYPIAFAQGGSSMQYLLKGLTDEGLIERAGRSDVTQFRLTRRGYVNLEERDAPRYESRPGVVRLSGPEAHMVINGYIGVSGGYLGGDDQSRFTYRSHEAFYADFCDLHIDVADLRKRQGGTTKQLFGEILMSVDARDQAKILRGVLAKYPPSSSKARATLAPQIHALIARLAPPADAGAPETSTRTEIPKAAVLRPRLALQSRVGRFEVLAPLGTGGMGDVYKARDTSLDDVVALKVVHTDPTRFKEEVRLARRVTHHGVCRIHEFGEDAGVLFCTMELVEGETLKQLLEQGPLEPHRVARLGVQISEALNAIHAKGIVHRDIKPSNIMLDREGQIRIMDLGIAKDLDPEETRTGTTGVIGSAYYMSPERFRSLPADVRGDIYSLGIVLFELATGFKPFPGPLVMLPLQHAESRLPLERPEASVLPEAFKTTLLRCTEKDPQHRFATALEVAEALRAILDSAR